MLGRLRIVIPRYPPIGCFDMQLINCQGTLTSRPRLRARSKDSGTTEPVPPVVLGGCMGQGATIQFAKVVRDVRVVGRLVGRLVGWVGRGAQ